MATAKARCSALDACFVMCACALQSGAASDAAMTAALTVRRTRACWCTCVHECCVQAASTAARYLCDGALYSLADIHHGILRAQVERGRIMLE
jgi:hypothetical protein